MQINRYTGRVVLKPGQTQYGFIRLATVKPEADAPALSTSHDIFVHQDDCSAPLRNDMEVSFEVVSDTERKGDALRATDVDEVIVGELVLVGEDAGRNHALTDPRQLYVPPTPAQRPRMKPVAPEEVEQVLQNMPMPRMPRTSGHTTDAADFTRELMARLFPQFAAISEESGADLADERFDDVIRQAVEDHEGLGMQAQADLMLRQANAYKGLRALLQDEEDLLRPETLIPIQYLPDLFMAVPVWYFWADEETRHEAAEGRTGDKLVHPKLRHFCNLIPGERWTDTFLMFNRRLRTLGDYEGDIIPPKIIARMRKVAPLFDELIIMTPYHDVAGKDWEDLNWLRSIDPYVIGLIKGIPLLFVIGRFSDSGTFPLYSELVADTIAFLRQNVEKLKGFNRVDALYWYRNGYDGFHYDGRVLGTKLVAHTRKLLAAFDEGVLFDWLRGESGKVPTRT